MSKYVLKQDQCLNFKKNTKGFCIWGQFQGSLCFCKKARVYCHLAVRRIPIKSFLSKEDVANLSSSKESAF
jgi:hypothetical protein